MHESNKKHDFYYAPPSSYTAKTSIMKKPAPANRYATRISTKSSCERRVHAIAAMTAKVQAARDALGIVDFLDYALINVAIHRQCIVWIDTEPVKG